VLTFEVTFPGLTDLIDELDETYTVSVGGKSGTGTILDDDAVTVVSVGDATEWEGDNLTHLVTLSTTADRPLTYPFSVTDVTATANVDYNLANVTFTNGVTYDINTGLVTVPANVLTFEVTFPGLTDLIDELDETYTVSVGGEDGTGTILDDDIQISGTVYHDLNRLSDGEVNGTGTNAGGIYANLVDYNTNLVIASVLVDPNGYFVFNSNTYPAIIPNTGYNIILTSTAQAVGNTLVASSLPMAWENTGEFAFAGPGDDLSIDGILKVTTDSNSGTSEAKFGIIKVPDVTPIITAVPNVMNGPTNFYITVRVTELNMVATEGLITVLIPKDTRWTLNGGYNPALTQLGSITLDNNVWTYSQDPTYHIFTTTSSIAAGGFSYFGFNATWNAGQTKGIYTITSQIVSGSGGENRIDNNVDAEKLDYFIY
jgi:hypothetical protein